MFARDKRIGPYTYVYLVENVREEGRTKQRIIANLGRKEVVVARGDLDRLARSVVRLAQRSMVLSLVEGEAPPNARCRRIGPALLFERLWHEVGCRAVLEELAAGRQFEFAAERAVFLTVLHGLFGSGSARAAERWRADYRIEGTEALQLHHLYRAMAWLGEPLADQAGASELTPRCRKDLVEERLFARRRDLFAELSVVFMDTTSLSFEGRGGEELGRRGHSKDYRPDLHQMIVGLVMDQDGRPLCCELWPGNTGDVTTLLPVVDRLRARFSVGRICSVADRVQDRMLGEIGGKGLFVKEIEEALIAGHIDLAVHSLKDLETWLPDRLAITCVLPRDDPRDAFLSTKAANLAALPKGARVG